MSISIFRKIVEGIIHFVHKYIEPVHRFFQAQKKQRSGKLNV